jgi:hypothetical protein
MREPLALGEQQERVETARTRRTNVQMARDFLSRTRYAILSPNLRNSAPELDADLTAAEKHVRLLLDTADRYYRAAKLNLPCICQVPHGPGHEFEGSTDDESCDLCQPCEWEDCGKPNWGNVIQISVRPYDTIVLCPGHYPLYIAQTS